MLTPLKVKVVAKACTIRYDRGEDDIQAVVESYAFDADNNALIYAEIVSQRPDIVVPAAAA